MGWGELIAIIGVILLAVFTYRMVKGNPEAFSRGNLSKSFATLGVLALLLIGFVAFCIMLLRVG